MNNDDYPWFRKRGYLHFDEPVSLKKAVKYVSSPEKIIKHSFLPFLSFEVKSFKIKKDKSTKQLSKTEKLRPIAYSSHLDSHIYAFYAEYLTGHYELLIQENNLHENILAFRSLNKSNIEFAKRAFDTITEMGECSAVALDLSGFFDNLDHQILKHQWCKVIGTEALPQDHFAIYKSITSYSKVDKNRAYEILGISKNNPKYNRRKICTPVDFRNKIRKNGLIIVNNSQKGIPQGSPISALLSNIYMLDFDIEMRDYAQERGGHYYRYCDDMLFIVPTKYNKTLAGDVAQRIKHLKVELNTKKTEIRDFIYKDSTLVANMPLQYLGFIFDGSNILLRSSSLARYSERMKRGVRLAKATMDSKNRIRENKGEALKALFKKKLYARYSHIGRRNFLTYGYRAAKIMNSKAIKRQLKPLQKRLENEILK